MGKAKNQRTNIKKGHVVRNIAKSRRESGRNNNKQFSRRQRFPQKRDEAAEPKEPYIKQTPEQKKRRGMDQMKEMRADILKEFRAKASAAKESFATLNDAIENAPAFIEVLDARDPEACRYISAEKKIAAAKKPLIIVLNKVDLVPRDIAVSWIAEMRSVAPTVALSATAGKEAAAVLAQIVEQVCPDANEIAVIGIKGIGKSSICKCSEKFKEIPSYSFMQSTEEICLLDAAKWEEPISTLAVNTMSRATHSDDQPDLFSIFGISAEVESPEDLLDAFAELWRTPQKTAAKKFVNLFTSGQQRYFTVPSKDSVIEETAEQTAALELSIPNDKSTVNYVQFAPGEPLQVNDDLVNDKVGIADVDDLFDDDEEGEEEDGGEDGDEAVEDGEEAEEAPEDKE